MLYFMTQTDRSISVWYKTQCPLIITYSSWTAPARRSTVVTDQQKCVAEPDADGHAEGWETAKTVFVTVCVYLACRTWHKCTDGHATSVADFASLIYRYNSYRLQSTHHLSGPPHSGDCFRVSVFSVSLLRPSDTRHCAIAPVDRLMAHRSRFSTTSTYYVKIRPWRLFPREQEPSCRSVSRSYLLFLHRLFTAEVLSADGLCPCTVPLAIQTVK